MLASVDARLVAESVARELQERGALGVVLTGSHARGDPHRHSDLDIVALGRGEPRLRFLAGVLVSEAWVTADEVTAASADPGLVGHVVPGWRCARVLVDTDGSIAALKADAAAWTWDRLGDAPAAWLAREFPGYSEEVYRLVGHLQAGRLVPASVLRNVLANRLAWLLSVHLRLLYETENRLWDLVSDEMGEEWRRAQERALAITSTSIDDSCRASLELFRMAAATVRYALSSEQWAVVNSAIHVAERAA